MAKPLAEDLSEENRTAFNLLSFTPHETNSTSSDVQQWTEKAATRHGKLLADTESSDLYTKNTAPSYSILSKFSSLTFTDKEGRRYWDASSIESQIQWPRLAEIRSSQFFQRENDRIFFVRPPKGTIPGDFTLPVIDTLRPHTFYKKIRGEIVSTFQAFVVDNGEDELDSSGGSSHSSVRKSSFVVIRGMPR